jgi:hypothetical protein
MSNTWALLTQYMDETFSIQDGMQDHPLFSNRQRGKMTRAGISYILDKYVAKAREKSPMIPGKVTLPIIRRTKAMRDDVCFLCLLPGFPAVPRYLDHTIVLTHDSSVLASRRLTLSPSALLSLTRL